jgi:hypothetical protein
MIIKELWVQEEDLESSEKKWVTLKVIALNKRSSGYVVDGVSYMSEQMVATGYFPETGQIAEYSLHEAYIKTMVDEKNKVTITFESIKDGESR